MVRKHEMLNKLMAQCWANVLEGSPTVNQIFVNVCVYLIVLETSPDLESLAIFGASV